MEDFVNFGSKKNPKAPVMQRESIFVEGPLIVGAGPSGLATAACLKRKGIPCLIVERAHCIASLWNLKTYDRLHLHLPKQFCELPHMSFPKHYPTYPNKKQFISYLEDYVAVFELKPKFSDTVVSAEFDKKCDVWRIITLTDNEKGGSVKTEYFSKWLVVDSGENAEEFVPNFEGMNDFGGPMLHSSVYKNGSFFKGKKVLVVGFGNSGIEISLDLANHDAKPTIVVRDLVHLWPREVLGISIFEISLELLKWFPMYVVDSCMLLISYMCLGNISKFGIHKPNDGALDLKMKTGKTPVLDVITMTKIREGKVKVVKGIKKFAYHAVEFVDGTVDNFDAIILATGFRSNVPEWLKGTNFFSKESGFPIEQSPNGCWKGPDGLYHYYRIDFLPRLSYSRLR